MNNQNYVSADTRARVEQVMAELSFQPSSAARALAGHRSHQIAVICDNPSPWVCLQKSSTAFACAASRTASE